MDTISGSARRLAVLFATAQFIVVLDASSVNVALPKMADALAIEPSQLQWVITSYSVAFGGLLLAGGRIADVLGRRKTFIAGAWLFLVGSLGAGLASSFAVLIASRVVQGVAAAVLTPAGFALLTDTFRRPRERAWALGLLGSFMGVGFTVGTVVGGVLTSTSGWRAVFLANVPIAATIGIAAQLWVAREQRANQRGTGAVSATAITVGLAAVLFAIAQLDTAGPRRSFVLPAVIAVGGVLAFAVAERRAKEPLIPISFAASRVLWHANGTVVLGTAADAGVFVFLTVYFQQRRGLSPAQTTAILLLPGLGTVAAGRLVGVLLVARGARRTLVDSLALQAVAIGAMAERTPPLPLVVIATTIAAIAYVSAMVCAAHLATAPAAPDDGGLAGSLVNASNQLGSALGVAVVTSLVGAGRLARPLGSAVPPSGVWPVMLVGAALAAVGALLAQRVPNAGCPAPTAALRARARD